MAYTVEALFIELDKYDEDGNIEFQSNRRVDNLEDALDCASFTRHYELGWVAIWEGGKEVASLEDFAWFTSAQIRETLREAFTTPERLVARLTGITVTATFTLNADTCAPEFTMRTFAAADTLLAAGHHLQRVDIRDASGALVHSATEFPARHIRADVAYLFDNATAIAQVASLAVVGVF